MRGLGEREKDELWGRSVGGLGNACWYYYTVDWEKINDLEEEVQ